MIKQVTKQENLNEAYLQVYRNKGAAGVDKVQASELQEILHTRKEQYIEQIENGRYQPSPILGVEIPKGKGKTRLLGIPTVVDRVFQQALHQVLQPIFEPEFQKHSYGPR